MAESYNGIRYFDVDKQDNIWQKEKIENFIISFDANNGASTINEAVELYNIQKIVYDGTHLGIWNQQEITPLKNAVKQYASIYEGFISGISDQNLSRLYSQLWVLYIDNLWELFDQMSMYNNISAQTVIALFNDTNITLRSIMKRSRLVKHYNDDLAEYIRNSPAAADIIIDQLLIAEKKTLYFPKSLDPKEYDGLFQKYTAWSGANPNHLMALFFAQNVSECPVDDRTRLKAKKAYEKYWEERKKSGVNLEYGIGIRFADLPQTVQMEQDGLNYLISYDIKWLEDRLDCESILKNFACLFGQLDKCNRSNLPSINSEISALDRLIAPKGKKRYMHGTQFTTKNMLYSAQTGAYYMFLAAHKIHLESVFQWFFGTYLPSKFGADGFVFTPPTLGTSWSEKCRNVACEIDGVLKQFKLFVEDGFIDRELYEISSKPIHLSEIPSFINDKYAYAEGDEISKEMSALFSDQSLLSYPRRTGSNYHSLYDLLSSVKDMKLSDYMQNQIAEINWLKDRGSVSLSSEGFIQLNTQRCDLLYDLYNHDVLCLGYCGEQREIANEMKAAGELRYESSLFSEPEQNYYSYMMNQKEYADNKGIRNKYIHDTNSMDEEQQKSDYIELMKIMVMVVAKINEDFTLRARIMQNQ